MKKILIIIMIVVSVSLIGTGVYLSMNNTHNTPNEQQTNQEEQEYVEPNTKTLELPSISTPDNKITLSNTTIYYRDEISAFDIEVTVNEDKEELYLLIEFDLETETHLRAVYLKNIKANQPMKSQIQTEKDLTITKSWSVKEATKEEVNQAGFNINQRQRGV